MEFDFIHEGISDQKKFLNILNKIVFKYDKVKDDIKISKDNDEYVIYYGSDTSSITIHIHLYSHAEVYLSNKYYLMLLAAKMNFKTSTICQMLNSLVLLKKKELENDLDKILNELDKMDKKTRTIPVVVKKDRTQISEGTENTFWKDLFYFSLFK